MTYQQTLDYLFAKLPMYSRIGAAAYKENLDNTIQLCEFLGNPHQKFKSIHIAGTNGKGSVSHMLAAIFQQAGYKTGLYTSPHLKDFRERIKISIPQVHSLQMIDKDFIVSFTEKIKPLVDTIEPSFFELTVAMAFDYFAREEVQIAIIETGLGGRLDSTNVITPELSVITNVGLDHMNLLGDSLEKISAEKAGIIKTNTPVVIGEVLPETEPVFEKWASTRNAPLFVANRTRQIANWSWEKHELIAEVAGAHSPDHKTYHLDLVGLYQLKNLLTVLESCTQMQARSWLLTDEIIRKALRQVKKITGLHGRWEVIDQAPRVVLDVAHNTDGVKQLLEQIELTDHHALHLVLGFVKDKDISNLVRMMPATASFYFTQATIPRALPAEELQAIARRFHLEGQAYKDVNLALAAAREKAQPNDLIIVCGSVFLVGEVED